MEEGVKCKLKAYEVYSMKSWQKISQIYAIIYRSICRKNFKLQIYMIRKEQPHETS
jgi:hypothetical protein